MSKQEERSIVGRLRSSGDYEGYVALDVEGAFYNLTPDSLDPLVYSAGVEPSDWLPVRRLLEAFESHPEAHAGIPVGPEVSGLLGTIAMAPIWRRLGRAGFSSLWWVDDGTVPVEFEHRTDDVLGLSADQLRVSGRCLQVQKTGFRAWDKVHRFGSSGAAWESDDDAADARSHLMLSICLEVPDGVTRSLARLKRESDDELLAAVLGSAWLLHTFPKNVVDWLLTLPESEQVQSWSLEQLSRPVTSETECVHVQMARLVKQRRLSASESRRLLDLAGEHYESHAVPNHVAAAVAAASPGSGLVRKLTKRRAVDLVAECADIDTCRALISVLWKAQPSRSERSLLEDLAVSMAEVRPAVDVALAA